MDQSKIFTEKRPWGEFRLFVKNQPVTVKIITVKKDQAFSLQDHHNRSEFWRIISGTPSVTIGDTTVLASIGDEFMIPVGVTHRMLAVDTDAEFLEIATGEFDEADVERLEDNYGRA